MDPTLNSKMLQPKIPGHSGCSIEFIYDSGSDIPFLVKKATKDPSYVPRLLKQMEKLKNFAEFNNLSSLSIPRVLSNYADEREAHIIMEYSPSLDFIEHFSSCDIEEIYFFSQKIIQLIEKNIEDSNPQKVDQTILEQKVLDLCNKIHHQVLLDDEWKVSIINNLKEQLNQSKNYGEIPIGLCHGDLTLSNILFNRDTNKIVLIDFLDNFIESPLQDIVKIRQDTYYHWSLNLLTKRNYDLIRIKTILEFIDLQISTTFTKYKFYNEWYSFFQYLNLARIIPYVKEPEIMDFLINKLYVIGENHK